MHASTLSLATSIPTTTRSFCAIIQLPSLLGPGSKPMQLFGLRKTPDLSLAPRQALGPSSTNGLGSSDGRLPINRPFAYSGRFFGHKSTKETVKTIACGNAGRFRCARCCSCAFYQYKVHTRPRVQRAPGIPHALHGGREINAQLGRIAPRDRDVMFGADTVIPGRCGASNPESRDSPMRNCASEVWSCGPSRNDGAAV